MKPKNRRTWEWNFVPMHQKMTGKMLARYKRWVHEQGRSENVEAI